MLVLSFVSGQVTRLRKFGGSLHFTGDSTSFPHLAEAAREAGVFCLSLPIRAVRRTNLETRPPETLVVNGAALEQ